MSALAVQEERNMHRWLGKMESDKLKREHWRKSSQWCAFHAVLADALLPEHSMICLSKLVTKKKLNM